VGVVGSDEEGDGERDLGAGGVAGSRSVTTRMVKRGGTVMDGGVGGEGEGEVRMVVGLGTDGWWAAWGVEWAGRVTRWTEVETTWERAARRLK
jgi:hypothetical protein